MTKTTFLCDTCKKAIDVPTNEKGITLFPHCVITKNCEGIMSQVDKMFVSEEQYHTVGTSTDTWTQRPLMFTHTQLSQRKRWIVPHNLDAKPIINVYVDNPDPNIDQQTLLPDRFYTVSYDNNNQATIVFDTGHTGTAQCIVRQTSPNKVANIVAPLVITDVTLSPNTTIIIARSMQDPVTSISSIELMVETNTRKSVILTANSDNLTTTPWRGVEFVIINNVRYAMYSISLAGLAAVANTVASFWITKVNGVDVAKKSNYVILDRAPNSHPADRIMDRAVDVYDLGYVNRNSCSIINRTLFCKDTLITPVYPLMKVIE